MKKMNIILIVLLSIFSCQTEVPTEFSEDALNDSFINIDGESVLFKDVLKSYEGQTVVIDVWASWCGDCLKGMPKVKALQKEYGDVVFLFLSADKSEERWKKGIKKYNVEGDHYFMPKGMKSAFSKSIDLDWIPRYMVLGREGNIKLFRAIKADDINIKKALK